MSRILTSLKRDSKIASRFLSEAAELSVAVGASLLSRPVRGRFP
jgi:hypothetical protein